MAIVVAKNISRNLRLGLFLVSSCSRYNPTRTVLSTSNVISVKMAAYTTASGKKGTMDLSGIYPPIVTPFDQNEDISEKALEENFKKWNTIPFRGYVVQGSNGEYAFMRPDEKVDLVRKVRQLVADDKLILAGSGCEATRDTIEMTRRMAEAGADVALVVTPCYYKGSMTADALVSHYTKVADASPIPIILYSVPGNTGIDMSAEVVIKLSTHPNIIGVKDSGGDITKIGYMIHKTAQNNFQVLAGSASFLLASYCLGAVGGVCALANVLGKEVTQLHQLFHEGKMEEAKLLQHKLILPNTAVTKTFGVPGLKSSMDMMGFYGGPTRSPLLPLKDQQMAELKNIFSIFEGYQG